MGWRRDRYRAEEEEAMLGLIAYTLLTGGLYLVYKLFKKKN